MNYQILKKIQVVARKKILFLPHAITRMTLHERMVSSQEVTQVIFSGEMIEDYPEDKRGHSCLILGHAENKRPLHVVCSPKRDYLAVITAYEPSSKLWKSDFKTRK